MTKAADKAIRFQGHKHVRLGNPAEVGRPLYTIHAETNGTVAIEAEA